MAKTAYKTSCFLCPAITCSILTLFFVLSTLLVILPLYRSEKDIYDKLTTLEVQENVDSTTITNFEIKEREIKESEQGLYDFIVDVLSQDPEKPSLWGAYAEQAKRNQYRFWVEAEYGTKTLRSTVPDHHQTYQQAEKWVFDAAGLLGQPLDLIIDGDNAYFLSIRDDFKSVNEAMTVNLWIFSLISIIVLLFTIVWFIVGGCVAYRVNIPISKTIDPMKTGLLTDEEMGKAEGSGTHTETKISGNVDYVFHDNVESESHSVVGGGSDSERELGKWVSPVYGSNGVAMVESDPSDDGVVVVEDTTTGDIPGMVGPGGR